ncbi:MAG: AAA family ATPase [Chloroflexota bacterium]
MNKTIIPLSGYQTTDILYESTNSLVCRALRMADEKPVVLKMLRENRPSPERTAWFKREYQRTHDLSSSKKTNQPMNGVAEAYGLEKFDDRWVMVLEDFGGESLNRLQIAGQLRLSDFLKLAIEITDILGKIHQRHIIHKDINPSNIVWNRSTGQVKVIDFGISTELSREYPTFRNPSELEGTLAYISPEQTGRMNRSVDYRTDFYSLGVTFYELLTGQLPFPTQDVLELVHYHIAQQPIQPHEVRMDIPPLISEMVLKLMTKNAEGRYQSAQGLKTDLTECLLQWETNGQIISFSLGKQDATEQFQIPQKLYGREQETKELLTAFERVSQGTSEVMLVSGHSGTGKTALVQEVYKPITRQHGYFIAGKFDQFQQDLPYASLIQAFHSLVQQLLTESVDQIDTWRVELLEALGTNGQVIVEVIPEIEAILGVQPKVPELPAIESENRFNLVFQNFIHVFAQPEHPLVIFLDDLQWADGASLRLMQSLLTVTNQQHLFLIGAYRDNETDATHPLMLTLDEIKKSTTNVNHISLTPFDLSDTSQFIADTLNCSLSESTPLAELIQNKTNGNPFFLREFIKFLYVESLMTFDYEKGKWLWDSKQIQAQDITDNVVELMMNNIDKLSIQGQEILKLAACIGNFFDLTTLASVNQRTQQDTANRLREALKDGFILPLDDTYKLVEFDLEELTDAVPVTYKFVHDRVQQAAYALIPESARPTIHHQIGQAFLQSSSKDTPGPKIFDITNHLNLSKPLINRTTEKDELARLNLIAGRRAKESIAYDPALKYLNAGLEMIGEDSWERQYDFTLDLHSEAAEVSSFIGNYDQMHQLIARILQQPRSVLEQAKAYEILINAYYAQENYPEAMKYGREALALIDVIFPEQPDWTGVTKAIQEIESVLADKANESLVGLPMMTDPVLLTAIRIMNSLSNVAWNLDINLRILVICKQMYLSLVHGNSEASPFVYANYGVILAIMGHFDDGSQFSSVAYQLLERYSATAFKAKTYFLTCFIVRHWKEATRELLPDLSEAFRTGVEIGDLEYASNVASAYCQMSYVVGQNLLELEQDMAKYSQAIKEFKQTAALRWNLINWQGILNLMGRSDDPCRLVGEVYDEEKMLPRHLETNHYGALCHVYIWKLRLCYRFQQFHQAFENLIQMEQYFAVAEGTAVAPLAYLYSSLARLALFEEASDLEKEDILEKVAINQEKMKLWAENAPMNYLHKYYLVEAEHARISGKNMEARDYYDRAIALAQEHEYLNEVSLAFELAARFYLDKGESRLAGHYMREAYSAYQRWGALAKVKDLEERYPQLLPKTRTDLASITATTDSTSERQSSSVLDLVSILQAAQAIAGELEPEDLLIQIVTILIKNAGAESGYLILPQRNQLSDDLVRWRVEAEGHTEQHTVVTTLQSTPVDLANLSKTIVNYVTRTEEKVVLGDAFNEGLFTQDDYIITQQSKSILCMPLINQGNMRGLLYLENNLTTDAFTTDRVEVLTMLASQAAISLENAYLYEDLSTSEEKFRSLFANTPLGVFEIDMTHDMPTILAANRRAGAMYGWPADELASISIEQLIPSEAAFSMQKFRLKVKQGKPFTQESIHQRRYGQTFPVRMNVTSESGLETGHIIVAVEDITAEKERQSETAAIESERRRIASDIHDGLAQDLVALRRKASLWHDLVDAHPELMHTEIDKLLGTLDVSIRDVRRSIFNVLPLSLENLGFLGALRQFVENFGTLYQLDLKLEVDDPEMNLPNTNELLPAMKELRLFRVIQESLNNIGKHAQATSAQIKLDLTHPETVHVSIFDDGIGFSQNRLKDAADDGHVGLKLMRERVEEVNGTISIHSEEGEGTKILVSLPFI